MGTAGVRLDSRVSHIIINKYRIIRELTELQRQNPAERWRHNVVDVWSPQSAFEINIMFLVAAVTGYLLILVMTDDQTMFSNFPRTNSIENIELIDGFWQLNYQSRMIPAVRLLVLVSGTVSSQWRATDGWELRADIVSSSQDVINTYPVNCR